MLPASFHYEEDIFKVSKIVILLRHNFDSRVQLEGVTCKNALTHYQ